MGAEILTKRQRRALLIVEWFGCADRVDVEPPDTPEGVEENRRLRREVGRLTRRGYLAAGHLTRRGHRMCHRLTWDTGNGVLREMVMESKR